MKRSLAFLIFSLCVCSNSFGQEFIGRTQKFILNHFKNREDVALQLHNDSNIVFSHSYNKYQIGFVFKNGYCIAEVMSCNSESKNYFVSKYIEEGYSVVQVEEADENRILELENKRFYITITISKIKDTHLICVTTVDNK